MPTLPSLIGDASTYMPSFSVALRGKKQLLEKIGVTARTTKKAAATRAVKKKA